MREGSSSSSQAAARRYVFSCVTERPHLGKHLVDAARELGSTPAVANSSDAWNAPKWVSRVCWHLLDKRAPHTREYEREVRRLCELGTDGLIATGVAPIHAAALREIGRSGVIRANFSTDDPWNPINGTRWFFRALRQYDVVFTPRRANVADLHRLGCPRVEYLPFAYDPATHFPEAPNESGTARFGCDVAFIGGADPDRLPYVEALRSAGLKVRVYGGGWDSRPEWVAEWGGHVIDGEYRQAAAHARLQLCVVRRANRDGHVMRSFELPAMRTCILAEDTPEHREIFGGPETGRVAYFLSVREMVGQAQRLLKDATLREAMARGVFQHVVERSRNSYRDRLEKMFEVIGAEKRRRGRQPDAAKNAEEPSVRQRWRRS